MKVATSSILGYAVYTMVVRHRSGIHCALLVDNGAQLSLALKSDQKLSEMSYITARELAAHDIDFITPTGRGN
jgi:hypothetical protein